MRLLTFALAILIASAIVLPPSSAAQIPATSNIQIVTVDGRTPTGTATGIHVNPGDTLEFRATGRWCWGDPPGGTWAPECSGPSGTPGRPSSPTAEGPTTVPGGQFGQLAGRVGGWSFLIGSSATVQMQASGQLFLLMNDRLGSYGDNSGSISVTIIGVAGQTPPVAPVARRVVLFIQGIGTSLINDTEGPNPDCPVLVSKLVTTGTFSCIKETLVVFQFYGMGDFLNYSYNAGRIRGGRWTPNDYECQDIDRATLPAKARLVHATMRMYAQAHPAQRLDFTLVGHSYGGLVGFATIEALSPDDRFSVSSVIALQSPLGGVPYPVLEHWPSLLGERGECFVGFEELREMADDSEGTSLWHTALLQKAGRLGIKVSSWGNRDDCVYKPGACRRVLSFLGDHTDTQILPFVAGVTQDSELRSLGTHRMGHGASLSNLEMLGDITDRIGRGTWDRR